MSSEYKSPDYKLLNFFEKSRDKWKSRAINSSTTINNLKHMLNYYKKKHDKLKNEIARLKGHKLNQSILIEEDKKKSNGDSK